MTTIEETKDLPTLSVTKLTGSFEAYGKRMYMHKEYTLENDFQSKLKFWLQNQENEGKKNYEEPSRIIEVFRNFLKNKLDKYPPYNICKRVEHTERYC